MSLLDLNRAKDIVLEAIAAGDTIKDACAKACVSPGSYYVWKANDDSFKEALKMALTMRCDLMEEEAERRGVHGSDITERIETTDEEGNTTVTVKTKKRYSDALLVMLLKANRPERFSERVKTEVSGDVGLLETLAAARRRLSASSESGE